MKVERLGLLKLDRKVNHDINSSMKNCLTYVEQFLIYLNKHKSEFINEFVSKAKLRMNSAIAADFEYKEAYNLEVIRENLDTLNKYPELIDVIAKLHLSLLNIPHDYEWETGEKVVLQHLDTDKAAFHPRYYLLKQLIEMFDRNEAIQFFKDFIDERTQLYIDRPHRETMAEVYELDVKNGKNSESSKYLSILLNEGLYAGRVDSCMGFESLKELNDPELSELVTCYWDFGMVKKINSNFVLTRTCTLHTGPYCDNLYHDKRICEKIEHLPREFYDKL